MKPRWGFAFVGSCLAALLPLSFSSEAGIWTDRVPYVDARGSFVAGAPVGVEAVPGSPGNGTAALFPFVTDGCHLLFTFRLEWVPGGVTAGLEENEVFLGMPMKVELYSTPAGPLPLQRWIGSGGKLLGAHSEPLGNETSYELHVHYVAGPSANFTFVALGQRTPELGCVLVNEIEANPAGKDAGSEWIELYNPTARSIPVGAWNVTSSHGNIETMSLPGDARLAPGEHLVVTFAQQFLDNTGDSVKLIHPLDTIVEETPWFVDTSDDARTWQRVPDAGENWAFASGTPGAANS